MIEIVSMICHLNNFVRTWNYSSDNCLLLYENCLKMNSLKILMNQMVFKVKMDTNVKTNYLRRGLCDFYCLDLYKQLIAQSIFPLIDQVKSIDFY